MNYGVDEAGPDAADKLVDLFVVGVQTIGDTLND